MDFAAVKWAFVALLVLASAAVKSQECTPVSTPEYYIRQSLSGVITERVGSSASAACQQTVAPLSAWHVAQGYTTSNGVVSYEPTLSMGTVTETNCQVTGSVIRRTGTSFTTNQVNQSYAISKRTVMKCPDLCAYTSGKAVSSEDAWISVPGSSKTPPASACINQCKYNISAGSGWVSGVKDGKWTHTTPTANTKGDGTSCTPTEGGTGEGPPAPLPDPLPPGKCPGTVNGQPVVVPCDSAAETPAPTKTETTESSASSPTGTKPGTGTTEKTTECTGDKCTTTTKETTNGADGKTETKETKTEQPKADFCKDNPQSKLCTDEKNESEFGGACEGSFTCKGDAIQCAIAQDQHKRHCEFFDKKTPVSEIGTAAGNGEVQPAGHPGNATEVMPFNVSALIDSNPLFASGGCPSDVSVGRYSIPFSRMCGSLNLLSGALRGFAFLIAAFIIFRRGS